MGPNMARLLTTYWYWQRIMPKTGRFIRKEFWTGGGLTQGDPASPIIFNIVVGSVVQVVLGVVCGPQ